MSAERALAFPSVKLDNMSSVACGTVFHNNKSQVSTGSTQSNSSFVYDTQSQETTEVSRNDAVLGDDGQSAHIEMGNLVTVNGERGIQGVIKSDATSTTLSSLQGGLTARLTIDGSLSWDRDECCLYLSANKAFRFKYIESDGIKPSMLVLEGLNPTTLQYMPKFEISSD